MLQAPEQAELSVQLLVAFGQAHGGKMCAGQHDPNVEFDHAAKSIKPQPDGAVDQLSASCRHYRVGTAARSLAHADQYGGITRGTGNVFNGRPQALALNSSEGRRRKVSPQELLFRWIHQISKGLHVNRQKEAGEMLPYWRVGEVVRVENRCVAIELKGGGWSSI